MKLKEARARKLLSMRELAEKAGVSLAAIRDLEQGKYLPRMSTIRKLSEALQVDAFDVDEFRASIESAAGNETAGESGH